LSPAGLLSAEFCHTGGFDVPSIGGAGESQFDLRNLTIPMDQLLHGGPPKDGIPALTEPKTVRVARADFLLPDDRIVAVTKNDESRAYPIRLLNWHEIVNDTLGGVPIAVVYCPLCDSVTVVDRRMDGAALEFGVSGMLYQSNVLMYDRTHNALWSFIRSGSHGLRRILRRRSTASDGHIHEEEWPVHRQSRGCRQLTLWECCRGG